MVEYPPPVATDNCTNVTVTCTPPSGSIFPIGPTKVHCVAEDGSGNKASCDFSVTINPTVTCPPLKIVSASSASFPGGGLSLVIETPYPELAMHLEETPDLAVAQWAAVPNVQFSPPQGNIVHAFLVPAGSPRFYRVISLMPQQ